MSSSKLSSSRRIVAVLLPITALSLTACGSLPFGSKDASPTTETSTTAPSPTPTPTPSESASATASATEMASATASEDPSASAEATTNGLTPENSKGRELRLSDFQEPSATSDWQEKRYDVASTTNIMGIGTNLDWQNKGEIELRLANKFQKVTFTAGQANDAKSSDLIMRVAIFADSKEIETVDVPFNDAHAFEVKAANVNALKITLTPLDQKQEVPVYTQSTTGVIFNVKAE
ncbi:hypothetical protein BKH06_08155 [Actinomyces naeslundii]|uniref:hypothetical protein n=1 Tax=Actinomyces naeslundii TaxID=1655 RepID=UPI00096ECDF3|nr:hypothetical protein [Actinomyces naeslundii]OMG10796.1 hypothetical protein BKH06_08155 [Actinomyces naeslundii]